MHVSHDVFMCFPARGELLAAIALEMLCIGGDGVIALLLPIFFFLRLLLFFFSGMVWVPKDFVGDNLSVDMPFVSNFCFSRA